MTRTKGARDKGPRKERAEEKVKRKPRTLGDDCFIAVQLRADGLTMPAIGAELGGITRQAVQSLLRSATRT